MSHQNRVHGPGRRAVESSFDSKIGVSQEPFIGVTVTKWYTRRVFVHPARMSSPEKNGASPESQISTPKNPVESTKNRLDQIALKNSDPAFKSVIDSLK